MSCLQSMISAVLAVEKRTRAQLIMENEKERMFFLMQSALMVIALRETHVCFVPQGFGRWYPKTNSSTEVLIVLRFP